MWSKSFFISFLLHLIIILFLSAIPAKKQNLKDYITVDFTVVTIGSGGGNIGNNGKGDSKNKTEKFSENKNEQNTNKIKEVPFAGKLENIHKDNELSLNPVIENNTFNYSPKGGLDIQGSNTGAGGYGYGHTEKGIGSGTSKTGGGGGTDGYGYGGINISDYGYLRNAIMKNIIYPEKARRMGWEGKVVLSFVINETGSIKDVKILKSSGYPVLDEAAMEAIFKINQFQKKQERLIVQLPVEFRLK